MGTVLLNVIVQLLIWSGKQSREDPKHISLVAYLLALTHTYLFIRCLLATIADSDPANVIFGKSQRF